MDEETVPTLTPAQAEQVVVRGINREAKRGNAQAHDLVRDAILLKEHNVRKLATVAESKGQLKVGFDSYLSYMSNAAGVAGMFNWDIQEFKQFLDETDLIGLSAIYRAFRELFGPAKPEKVPAEPAHESDPVDEDAGSKEPLVDQVLAALPHLTYDEIALVVMAGQMILDAAPQQEAA